LGFFFCRGIASALVLLSFLFADLLSVGNTPPPPYTRPRFFSASRCFSSYGSLLLDRQPSRAFSLCRNADVCLRLWERSELLSPYCRAVAAVLRLPAPPSSAVRLCRAVSLVMIRDFLCRSHSRRAPDFHHLFPRGSGSLCSLEVRALAFSYLLIRRPPSLPSSPPLSEFEGRVFPPL